MAYFPTASLVLENICVALALAVQHYTSHNGAIIYTAPNSCSTLAGVVLPVIGAGKSSWNRRLTSLTDKPHGQLLRPKFYQLLCTILMMFV